MRRRSFAAAASTALVASLGLTGITATAGAAAPSGRSALVGTHSSVVARAKVVSHVAGAAEQSIEVVLNTRDAAGVAALATAVSNPASTQFHHYLTAAQWEARFSPTAASVSAVSTWLRSQGLTVGATSADRLSIDVSGTTAQVERALGVALNNYLVNGRTVQLAASDVSIPSALAGIVSSVNGLDQTMATPSSTNGSDEPVKAESSSSPIPQPPGFRVPQDQCAAYYGQKMATTLPAYGGGYPKVLPLAPCGYTPEQFQSAYGLSADYAKGITGKGVKVAIIDAYASPTLLSDAQTFYHLNDPKQPLVSSDFSELVPKSYNDEASCDASGWFGEQTLDVEAVHATAPGAKILYAGAQNCYDDALLSPLRQIVDGSLAQVITNSYGDDAGDLLDSAGFRSAEDTVLQMAAATGITVNFSAGDSGDEFAGTGLTTPDYPSSSPWVTAVGGTSLAINAEGTMTGQVGWSTSKSLYCTATLFSAGACTKAQEGTYIPPAPGGYDYGGGGGTSYHYAEPYYQKADVPAALADRNELATGLSTPNRVEPDISMDADPTTGMLIGETQTFPNGVYYGQYRIGGTSVASPLFAGVVALADQDSGVALGFLNPILYKAAGASGSAKGFDDVQPKGNLAVARVDFLNEVDSSDGYLKSIRTLGYEGSESYCDLSGNCATRNVVISTAKGYDDMTGLGTPETGFVGVLAKY